MNKGGRPTKVTPLVVKKLNDCFRIGATVEEACSQAKISKPTFYKKLKEDEEFSNEITWSRHYPLVLAQGVVVTAIEAGDAQLAMKYLERRDPRYAPHYRRKKSSMEDVDSSIEVSHTESVASKLAAKFQQPKQRKIAKSK